MNRHERPGPNHTDMQVDSPRERAIKRKVLPQTYDFLIAAIKSGAHKEIDVRRRNLIGIYFGTDVSLSKLAPVFHISKQRVHFLIRFGLLDIWNNLPPHLKEKYPRNQVLKLKHREGLPKKPSTLQRRKHTPETKARISRALKGRPGRKHTPETKAKISEAKKGKKHTPETKAKLSEAHSGKKVSPETKAKLSEATKRLWQNPDYVKQHTGRKQSPEAKAKISRAHSGKKVSSETGAKISKALKGRPGRKQSPETRAKLSETMKLLWQTKEFVGHTGRKHSPETKAKLSESAKKRVQKRKDV